MGEVEQYRMSASTGTKSSAVFQPDDSVEKALVKDVETAWKNLTNYLARCKAQ